MGQCALRSAAGYSLPSLDSLSPDGARQKVLGNMQMPSVGSGSSPVPGLQTASGMLALPGALSGLLALPPPTPKTPKTPKKKVVAPKAPRNMGDEKEDKAWQDGDASA
eukprot:12624813-Alexandrium_andersonii.AAC.1